MSLRLGEGISADFGRVYGANYLAPRLHSPLRLSFGCIAQSDSYLTVVTSVSTRLAVFRMMRSPPHADCSGGSLPSLLSLTSIPCAEIGPLMSVVAREPRTWRAVRQARSLGARVILLATCCLGLGAAQKACFLENLSLSLTNATANISSAVLLSNVTAVPPLTPSEDPRLACTLLTVRSINAFTIQDGTFDGFTALRSLALSGLNFSSSGFPPRAFAGLPQLESLSFQRIASPPDFSLPPSWADALSASVGNGSIPGSGGVAARSTNLTSFSITDWGNVTSLAAGFFAGLPRLANVTISRTGVQYFPARLFQALYDLRAPLPPGQAGALVGQPLLRIDVSGNAQLATVQSGCRNISNTVAAGIGRRSMARPAIFLMPLLQSNGSAAGIAAGGSGGGDPFANVTIAGPSVVCTLVDNVNECLAPDGVAPGTVDTPTHGGTDPWVPATGDDVCPKATSVCVDRYAPWYYPPGFGPTGKGLCYNCKSACAFDNWLSGAPLSSADTELAGICSSIAGINMTVGAAWRNVSGVGWVLTCFEQDALSASLPNITQVQLRGVCVMGEETAAPGELPPWLAPPYEVPVPPAIAGAPGVTGTLAVLPPAALNGLVKLGFFYLQMAFISPPSWGAGTRIIISPEWRADWGQEGLPNLRQLIAEAPPSLSARAPVTLPPSAMAQLAFAATFRDSGGGGPYPVYIRATTVNTPQLLPAGLLSPATYEAFAARSAAAGMPPGPVPPAQVSPMLLLRMGGYNESLFACDATATALYSGSYSQTDGSGFNWVDSEQSAGASSVALRSSAFPLYRFNSSLAGFLPREMLAASPRLDRALLMDAATLRTLCPSDTAAARLCPVEVDPTAPIMRECTLFPNLNQCPPRSLRNGTWALTPDVRRSAWLGAAAASPRDYAFYRGAPRVGAPASTAQQRTAAAFAATASGSVGAALLRLDAGAGAVSATTPAGISSSTNSTSSSAFVGAAVLWGGRPVAGCAGAAVPSGLRQPSVGSPVNGSGSVGFQDTPLFYDSASQSWYAAPGMIGRAQARVGAAAAFVPSLSAVIVLGGVDSRAACALPGAPPAPAAPVSDAIVMTIRSSASAASNNSASGTSTGGSSGSSGGASSSVFASPLVDTVFTSTVPVTASLPGLLNAHARVGASAVFVPVAAAPSVAAGAGYNELTYGTGLVASSTGTIVMYGGTWDAPAALLGATITVRTGAEGLLGFRPIDPLVDGSGVVTAALGANPPFLALGSVLGIDAAQTRTSLVLPCELTKGIEPTLDPPSAATQNEPWVPHPRAFHVALFVPALGEHGRESSAGMCLRVRCPLLTLLLPCPYRASCVAVKGAHLFILASVHPSIIACSHSFSAP